MINYSFLAHMSNAQETLSPFLKLIKSRNIAKSQFSEYVQCYYEIILK